MDLNNTALFLCLCFFSNLAQGNDLNLSVSTKLYDANSQSRLSFSIDNIGTDSVKLYKADLPWGNLTSTLLIVAKANRTGDLLERSRFIDDPSPEMIAIPSGKNLVGAIDLNKQFPNLYEARCKSDYLLFWSYRAEDINDAKSSRFGGMVLLPQLRKESCPLSEKQVKKKTRT